MTKPVTRKMAVDALLYRFALEWHVVICTVCHMVLVPGDDIDFDHIHADVHGGPHEYQNLRPLHRKCHRKKTGRDVSANAKIKRLRGERKPKPKRAIRSKGFSKGVKQPWPKQKVRGSTGV